MRGKSGAILLVVAAISVAAGSGRKPAEEVQVSMRHISTSEAMDILRKFPELIPDFLAKRKDDAEYMAGTFGFVEVMTAPLARVFPTARFYIGHDFTTATNPYLMAISDGKRYMMPYGFKHLLFDFGLNVTDKNIVELAEALAIVAIGSERGPFPELAFLGATTTKMDPERSTDAAKLKVKIGAQKEEWHSYVWRNQFYGATSINEKGLIKDYHISEARSPAGRWQLNPTPDTAIDTFPTRGDASAERDSPGAGLVSGSEPEEGQEVKVSLQRLSSSEVMTIFDKYPETVSGEPAHPRGSEVLASLYPLSEVTAAPLKRAFPNVRFFKELDTEMAPPFPYVMAIAGRKRYPMPCGLNQLLVDSDVRVTDSNLVEIAKAAVILALGADMVGSPRNTGYESAELLAFPKLTSLSAEMQVTGDSHSAKLTVRVGDSEESWYVHRWHDRLGWMSRGNANGLIKDYDIPEARPLRQR